MNVRQHPGLFNVCPDERVITCGTRVFVGQLDLELTTIGARLYLSFDVMDYYLHAIVQVLHSKARCKAVLSCYPAWSSQCPKDATLGSCSGILARTLDA